MAISNCHPKVEHLCSNAQITITISPTTSDANRFKKVFVQNGDVFDEFKFEQRGLKVGS